ncbi:MAG TPA: hypothetical protein VGJ18_24380 [Gemmatimonadaceae bacterium]|jgi:hypothetical protein
MAVSAPAIAAKTKLDYGSLASKVLVATAVVALLDGLFAVGVFAWILRATTAARIFQGIAAAVLGRADALAGGPRTALLGLAIHILVALTWTAVWALAYSRSATIRLLVRSTAAAVTAGALYGVFVHLTMQLAVLPLTAAGRGALVGRSSLLVLLAHLIVVGPPIVLIVRRPVADS